MRVNDSVNVRPHFVYQKVHRDFTRSLPFAFDLLCLHVDDDHVLGLDESFVRDRRRAHDVPVRQARADVAVGGSNIPLLVDEVAEARNAGAILVFGHGRHSIAANGFSEIRRKNRRAFPQPATTQTGSR